MEQGLTLFYDRTLRVITLDDIACDIRLHQRSHCSLQITDPLFVIGHIFLSHHPQRHWDWRSGRLFCWFLLTCREKQCGGEKKIWSRNKGEGLQIHNRS